LLRGIQLYACSTNNISMLRQFNPIVLAKSCRNTV
jgi:hypothetical protein